jgi:hypothetical protein
MLVSSARHRGADVALSTQAPWWRANQASRAARSTARRRRWPGVVATRLAARGTLDTCPVLPRLEAHPAAASI